MTSPYRHQPPPPPRPRRPLLCWLGWHRLNDPDTDARKRWLTADILEYRRVCVRCGFVRHVVAAWRPAGERFTDLVVDHPEPIIIDRRDATAPSGKLQVTDLIMSETTRRALTASGKAAPPKERTL